MIGRVGGGGKFQTTEHLRQLISHRERISSRILSTFIVDDCDDESEAAILKSYEVSFAPRNCTDRERQSDFAHQFGQNANFDVQNQQ
jgi:hypothetical protein